MKKLKDNIFICRRCGKETLYISFGSDVTPPAFCNSCASGLADGGTGNLLEFPYRDKHGKINFKIESYEIMREFKHLGIIKENKYHKKLLK